MERLNDRRVVEHSGITANGIRKWGMFLLAASVVGRSIIQCRIFGIGSVTGEELLAIMEKDQNAILGYIDVSLHHYILIYAVRIVICFKRIIRKLFIPTAMRHKNRQVTISSHWIVKRISITAWHKSKHNIYCKENKYNTKYLF